jgi:hypothetical protein
MRVNFTESPHTSTFDLATPATLEAASEASSNRGATAASRHRNIISDRHMWTSHGAASCCLRTHDIKHLGQILLDPTHLLKHGARAGGGAAPGHKTRSLVLSTQSTQPTGITGGTRQ